MRKQLTLFAFFIFHCAFFIGEAYAQTPPPGGLPSPGAPLDGLTGLLLAGGAAYGYRRIRKRHG